MNPLTCLEYADVIVDHPPEQWIEIEEKQNIGKIIPVEITIRLKGE